MPTAFDDLLVDAPNDQFGDLLVDEQPPAPVEEPVQSLAATAAYSFPKAFSNVATGTVGGIAKMADVGAEIVDKYTGIGKPEIFKTIGDVMDDASRNAAEMYPVDERNPLTATVFGGAAQGISLLAGGALGKAAGLGEAALTRIPLALGAAQGANQGIDTARELGVESPEARFALGALFGGTEVLTEKLESIGNKAATEAIVSQFREPAEKMLKDAAKAVVSEGGEEIIAGSAQDWLARAFATEDPSNPGFTKTGVPLPEVDPRTKEFLTKRGMEFLGGAAGGGVFAGAQVLANAGKPEAPPPSIESGESVVPEFDEAALEELAGIANEAEDADASATADALRWTMVDAVVESDLGTVPVIEGDLLTDFNLAPIIRIVADTANAGAPATADALRRATVDAVVEPDLGTAPATEGDLLTDFNLAPTIRIAADTANAGAPATAQALLETTAEAASVQPQTTQTDEKDNGGRQDRQEKGLQVTPSEPSPEALIPGYPSELEDSREYTKRRVSEGLSREEAAAELASRRSEFTSSLEAQFAPGDKVQDESGDIWVKNKSGRWRSEGEATGIRNHALRSLDALPGAKVLTSNGKKPSTPSEPVVVLPAAPTAAPAQESPPVAGAATIPEASTRDYEPGNQDPKEIPPQTPEEQPSTEEKPSGDIRNLPQTFKPTPKQKWDWEVADDAGGTAFGNLKNGVADIIGMEASPTGKRYSEPEKYLRRGFFRQLVKTLQSQGAKTLKITMQSGDTRKALARLVETGELVNPRGVAGISVDEHPTTFDIPEPRKNVLTDASTPVTGGDGETTIRKEADIPVDQGTGSNRQQPERLEPQRYKEQRGQEPPADTAEGGAPSVSVSGVSAEAGGVGKSGEDRGRSTANEKRDGGGAMKAPEQMSPDEFESMRGKVIKLYDESAMPPKSEGQKKAEFKVQMLEGELKKARTLEGGQARGVRRSRGAVKTEADLQAELDAAKKVVADEKDAWGKEQARKEEILWDEVQKSAPEAVSSGLVYREMLDGKLRVMNRVGLPSSGKDLIRSAIRDSKPVSAAAVEAYGIKLPSGYVKQGELFVFQPQTPSQPAQAPAVQAAAQAGVQEARSEDGGMEATTPQIEKAIVNSGWRGTVRSVDPPKSWGMAAGSKLFIPVDAAGKDVGVRGQTILGNSPEEAIKLAQANTIPNETPTPQTPSQPPDAASQFVAEFAALFPSLPKVSSLTPQQAASGIESILNDGKKRSQLEVALLRKTLAMYNDMAGYGVFASFDPRLNAIVAAPGTSPSTLAHEVGHLIERTLLKDASPETQKAIRDSYERWLKSKDGGNNLTETDRARFWDQMTEEGWANPDAKYEAGEKNKRYITGFKEWFADQVGRWASTNAKPASLIDRFFSDVAAKLKQFFDRIQQRFMPDKTVADWLDQLSGPAPKPTSKPPDKIQYYKDQIASDEKRVAEIDAAIEDWSSRRYKKTEGTLEIDDKNPANFYGTRDINLGQTNERKRAARIRNLGEEKAQLQSKIRADKKELQYLTEQEELRVGRESPQTTEKEDLNELIKQAQAANTGATPETQGKGAGNAKQDATAAGQDSKRKPEQPVVLGGSSNKGREGRTSVIKQGDSIKFKTEGKVHDGKFLGLTKDGKGYTVAFSNGSKTTVSAHQINEHNGGAVVEGTRFSMPSEKKESQTEIGKLREWFNKTGLVTVKKAKEMLGGMPEHLGAVVSFMQRQREKAVAGSFSKRDIAKAYLMTLGSIGSSAINVETFERKTGLTVPSEFKTVENGKEKIRPEEAVALWFGTATGKSVLDAIDAGDATASDISDLLRVRDAFGRNDIRNNALRIGGRGKTLSDIAEITDKVNAAKGDVGKINEAVSSLTGIGPGKLGFIKHLLGFGDSATIDAVELNFWLTGSGKTNQLESKRADLVRKIKSDGGGMSGEVATRIENQIKRLAAEYGLDENYSLHVIHHWLWDMAKGVTTTHDGMMKAMELFALPASRSSMPLDKARAHVFNKLRYSPRKVRVISEPSMEFRGRYDPTGEIVLNTAYLGSIEELNDVLHNHEAIHDAVETDEGVRKQADKLLGALTEDELTDIEADLFQYKDSGFSESDLQAERQVEAIRKLTANRPDLRSAWGRLVESVSLKLKRMFGGDVTRQQAELVAARIVARGLKRLRKGKTGGRIKGGTLYGVSPSDFFDDAVSDPRGNSDFNRTVFLPSDTKIPRAGEISPQDVKALNAAWTSPEAKEWFTFGKTESRDADDIASAFSTPDSPITATSDGSKVVFEASNGGRIVVEVNTSKGNAVLNILKNGPAAGQLYQAALTYLHNNDLEKNNLRLTERNAGIRLVSNMLSSALRHGTTKHLNGHGISGIIWRKGDDAWNIAQLARHEQLYVFGNLQPGEIKALLASAGLDGTGLVGTDAPAVEGARTGTLAEVLARPARYGIGPKTVARAAVTASVLQGKDGAVRQAADRIAAVKPLYQASPSDVTRFKQLTASIPKKPTAEQLETWKQEHPAEYKELEAMRERVLREMGYTVGPVYHGTEQVGLTEFYGGWWSDTKKVTREFGSQRYSAFLKGPLADGETLRDLYKKFNGTDIDPDSDEPLYDSEIADAAMSGGPFSRYVQDAGYQGIEVFDESNAEVGMAYSVFNQSQIKSADPLATDDSGNLITPESWGDETSPDIRYGPDANIPGNNANEPSRGSSANTQGISPQDNSERANAIREAAAGIDRENSTRGEKAEAVANFARRTAELSYSRNPLPDWDILFTSDNSTRANAKFSGVSPRGVSIDFNTNPVAGMDLDGMDAEGSMAFAYDTMQEEMIHSLQYVVAHRQWVKAGKPGTYRGFVTRKAAAAINDAVGRQREAQRAGNTELAAKIKDALLASWNLYHGGKDAVSSVDELVPKLNSRAVNTPQYFAELTRQMAQLTRQDFTTETGWLKFKNMVLGWFQDAINSLKAALPLARGGQLGPIIQQEISELESLMKNFENGTPKPLYSLVPNLNQRQNEPVTGKEKRGQAFGQPEIAQIHQRQSTAVAYQAAQAVFNSAETPVTPESRTTFLELMRTLLDPRLGPSLAQDLIEAGNDMAPVALQDEMATFALRAAAEGDVSLLNMFLNNVNRMSTGTDSNVSKSARELAMRRWAEATQLLGGLDGIKEERDKAAIKSGVKTAEMQALQDELNAAKVKIEELLKALESKKAKGSGKNGVEVVDAVGGKRKKPAKAKAVEDADKAKARLEKQKIAALQRLVDVWAGELGDPGSAMRDKVASETTVLMQKFVRGEISEAELKQGLLKLKMPENLASEAVNVAKARVMANKDIKQYQKQLTPENTAQAIVDEISGRLADPEITEAFKNEEKAAINVVRELAKTYKGGSEEALLRERLAELPIPAELQDELVKTLNANLEANKVIRSDAQPTQTAQAIVDAHVKKFMPNATAPVENRTKTRIEQALRMTAPTVTRQQVYDTLKKNLTELQIAEPLADSVAKITADAWQIRRSAAIEEAVEKVSAKWLLQQILKADVNMQQSPNWRQDMMAQWLSLSGFTAREVELAVKVLDKPFGKALADARLDAAERYAEQMRKVLGVNVNGRARLKKAVIPAIERVQNALRTGSFEGVSTEMAKWQGWKPLSAAELKRLNELDAQIKSSPSRPYPGATPPHYVLKATHEMFDIFKKHVSGSTLENMAIAFHLNLLSGLPTAGVNIIGPPMKILGDSIIDIARAGATLDIGRFQSIASALKTAVSTYFKEGRFTAKYDISDRYGVTEITTTREIANLNYQLDKWLAGLKQAVKDRSPTGILKGVFGISDIVRRFLTVADTAGTAAVNAYSLIMGAHQMAKDAGVSTRNIRSLFTEARMEGQRAYGDAVMAGYSPEDAGTAAIDAQRAAILGGVYDFASPEKAFLLDRMSKQEGFLAIGRKPVADDLNEDFKGNEITDRLGENLEGGLISRHLFGVAGMNDVLEAISAFKYGGNTPKAKALRTVLGTLMYGLVHVPYRASRHFAAYSPYGFIRYGVKKLRDHQGKENWYMQSMGTPEQEQTALWRAAAGTALMALIASLFRGSDELEEKDKDYITVTGNGPPTDDPQVRDAWIKQGNQPYHMKGRLFGVPFNVNIGRGGEVALFAALPFAVADDLALRDKIRGYKSKDYKASDIVDAFSTYVAALSTKGGIGGLIDLSGKHTSTLASGKGIASAVSGYAANVIPLNRFIQTTENLFITPPDKSTVETTITANIPLARLGNFPALNRMGDPVGDASWLGKISYLGVPLPIDVEPTAENKKVYEVIHSKMAAPGRMNRVDVEKKYGELTNRQWYDFVKASGGYLSKRITDSHDKLMKMNAGQVDEWMAEVDETARARAANGLGLRVVKVSTVSR